LLGDKGFPYYDAVMNRFTKNYLSMVRNAARGDNNMFRNYYLERDGVEVDVLKDGAFSCAVFVSSVLYLQNSSLEFAGRPRWISYVHANVPSNEKDMEANGWRRIEELREGAVITWEPKPGADGTPHLHQGFFVGNERAVSNGSNSTLMPQEHHVTYDGTRKIERIWWHESLED
jgi:hypothetical protein